MLNIEKKLISLNYSKGVTIIPKYVVVHETDNESPTADAEGHYNYWNSDPNAQTSAHFVVDENKAIQLGEFNWRMWHCGEKYNPNIGNFNTIAVEICVNGNYMKARQNAIELIKDYILPKTGIPVSNLIRHFDVTGKTCPRKMINNPSLWKDFINQVSGGQANNYENPSNSTNIKLLSNFSVDPNARIQGDWFYVRDSSGNIIPDRYVSNGDEIAVINISAGTQLVEVEYKSITGYVVRAYIKNVSSLIKYYYPYQYQNGSTSEDTFEDSDLKYRVGKLSPYEKATPLYRKSGKLCVAYDTSSGKHTKSAFVNYDGQFSKF